MRRSILKVKEYKPKQRKRPPSGRPRRARALLERPVQFDPILPEQFFIRITKTSGEKLLMMNILARAFMDLESPPVINRSRKLEHSHERYIEDLQSYRKDALDWFEKEDRAYCFSFVSICDNLGLDAGEVRKQAKKIYHGQAKPALRFVM